MLRKFNFFNEKYYIFFFLKEINELFYNVLLFFKIDIKNFLIGRNKFV